jgi:hypothetical protein
LPNGSEFPEWKGSEFSEPTTLISILPKFLIILKFPFQVLNYSKARAFGFAGVLDDLMAFTRRNFGHGFGSEGTVATYEFE